MSSSLSEVTFKLKSQSKSLHDKIKLMSGKTHYILVAVGRGIMKGVVRTSVVHRHTTLPRAFPLFPFLTLLTLAKGFPFLTLKRG